MQTAPMPPYNQDAERSVLGAMLRDPAAVSLSLEQLTAAGFHQPAHREIFDAMLSLSLVGRAIDLITVDEELSRRGTLEGIGGTQYLVQLTQYVPATANVQAYIDIVNEKFTLRQLIDCANGILQRAYSQDVVDDLLAFAEKSIFDISMGKGGTESLVHIREVLIDTYARIEKLWLLKGQLDGVPTGFSELDQVLAGMHGGELILIGARPSMGKTSFAMNIVEYAAMNSNKSVAMFSLEMPREQIAMRLLCGRASVDMQQVRRGTISDKSWLQLTSALSPMSQSNIYIDDTPGISPTQLRSRCRRLKTERGLDLIVIDYLQLMSSDKGSESRQHEVSEISRSLKAIALELDVPLIACAQLSRANAQRADKRPILSDLRDSGSIEQDADVVMFLHREEYYDADTPDKNMAEVIVQKQRNGPLGTIKLAWLGQYTRFRDL